MKKLLRMFFILFLGNFLLGFVWSQDVEKLREEGSQDLKREEERLERNLKDFEIFEDVRIIPPI